MNLEEKLKKDWTNLNPNEIDKKFKLDKKSSLSDIITDTIKYIPVIATQAIVAPTIAATTSITAAGFAIGGYFESRKNGKKYTWQRLKRDLTSGNIFGFLDYGIFKVPEYFSQFIPYLGGSGLINKIAKLGFFETTIIPPAVAGYNSLEYIRDKITWRKFAGRMLTLKVPSTVKEIYQNAIKGKVISGTKSIYKIAPPLHFLQLNYLPTTALRMTQSEIGRAHV